MWQYVDVLFTTADEAKSSTKPSTPKSVVIAATAKPVTRIMERIIYR